MPATVERPNPPRLRPGRAVAVLLVVVALFLALELPAYLGFDPAASRVPARSDLPLHYPLLVAHILFGSVALVTACLQIWPWLRRTHPAVHRWSGRAYLFGGVFPGGLAVLAVAPVSSTGPVRRSATPRSPFCGSSPASPATGRPAPTVTATTAAGCSAASR